MEHMKVGSNTANHTHPSTNVPPGREPEFLRYTGTAEHAAHPELTMPQASAPAVEHHILPAPSGELWAADWFAILPLLRARDAFDATGTENLNSAAGCAERTRRYAQELGIGHVFVGDTGQTLVSSNGALLVGGIEDDSLPRLSPSAGHAFDTDRPTDLGRTTADLWWVTLADRQVLRDLMCRKVSAERAEQELTAYAENPPEGFHVFRVPPGTYHLYAAPTPHGFLDALARNFDTAALDFSPLVETAFVVTREPLEPRVTPSPKKRTGWFR